MATLSCGIGVRAPWYQSLLSDHSQTQIGFLEAHSENYFGHGPNREYLTDLSQKYPISLHGVSLSLGRADGVDTQHLKQLRQLIELTDAFLVSEHLAWSAFEHRHVPDLLPVPYTQATLAAFVNQVDATQQYLGRQILIENPANYLAFAQVQFHEAEFLNQLSEQTGCGVLLDLNNLYISSRNIGVDPMDYLQRLQLDRVQQFHLAGFIELQQQGETILIDSHNQQVADPVWDLYRHASALAPHAQTLIEWDSDFPELQCLIDQAQRANAIQGEPNE